MRAAFVLRDREDGVGGRVLRRNRRRRVLAMRRSDVGEAGVPEDLAGARRAAAGQVQSPPAFGSAASLSASAAQCAAMTSETGKPSSA